MSILGQQLIEIVRAKALEQPDFVYYSPDEDVKAVAQCKYVHQGQPSCLIGQALWSVGLIDAMLESTGLNCAGIERLFRSRLDWEIDPDELEWLRVVQRKQDSHFTWGEAVAVANEVVGHVRAR